MAVAEMIVTIIMATVIARGMGVGVIMRMVVIAAVTAWRVGASRGARRGSAWLWPRRVSQPFQQGRHIGGAWLRLTLDGQALQGHVHGDVGDARQSLHSCLDFQRAGGAVHTFNAIALCGGGRIHDVTRW
ncbi:hypothetical protein GCM10019059_25140 [Camelimonas fluminis]|nr:hypothetical protein GCM10019059_25140 [Camelimonas fluminis]